MAAATVLEDNGVGPVSLEILHGEAGSGSACDGFNLCPPRFRRPPAIIPQPKGGTRSPDGQFALSSP
jgi:hypothetical protein